MRTKVLILTDNQFLKYGLEKILQQKDEIFCKDILIFDAENRIVFLQKEELSESLTRSFFEILTKGIFFNKEDIKSVGDFLKCLSQRRKCNNKRFCRKNDGLSRSEYVVIKALCAGYSSVELADVLNKSIKTISTQKNSALRKLGVRNLQSLHRIMVRWNILVKSSAQNFYTDKYYQGYFMMLVPNITRYV